MTFKENLTKKSTLQETVPRDFKGIWIPREIWLHTELSWLEKMLWAEIDSLDCAESGCTASNEYFETFFGLTERSVQLSLARLKRLGLIAQTHFDGRRRTLRSSLKSTYEKFCTSEVQDESRGEKNFTSRVKKISFSPTPPYKEENKVERKEEKGALPPDPPPPITPPSKTSQKKELLSFGKHVSLAKEAYESICVEFGKDRVDECFLQINDWIDAKGNKGYKDYAAAARNWLRRDSKAQKATKKSSAYEKNKAEVRTAQEVLKAKGSPKGKLIYLLDTQEERYVVRLDTGDRIHLDLEPSEFMKKFLETFNLTKKE